MSKAMSSPEYARSDMSAGGHAEPRNRFLSEARHQRKNAAGVGPRRQWKKVGGEPESAKTFVLGLGNLLMGDDGFGPRVVQAFAERFDAGPRAEVIDLGTPGLDLTPWLADAGDVVIVDTVRASAPPGTLRVYEKDDIVRHVPFSRVGPHDPGLKEALLLLDFAGRAPQSVTLVGVVPERLAMGTELSPAVQNAVPKALDAIVEALARQHVTVWPRGACRNSGSSRRYSRNSSQIPLAAVLPSLLVNGDGDHCRGGTADSDARHRPGRRLPALGLPHGD
jgi:hydrogenase maturation protease